jgi:hypothetical protein
MVELKTGDVFKHNKIKYQVIDTDTTVPAIVYEEDEVKTQKTYMLKAACPSCGRIIRVTEKNFNPTAIRTAIMCVHADGTGNEFKLVD